jgi:hypothetical protein
LGQRFRCVDANFAAAARASYMKLPAKGVSYTLIEVHWGRCPDGDFRLAGNFAGLNPQRQGLGIWLHRFELEQSPPPYPTDQTLGAGCHIHTCALACYQAIAEDDVQVCKMFHPALHEPVHLFVGHALITISQASAAIP